MEYANNLSLNFYYIESAKFYFFVQEKLFSVFL